MECIGIIGGVVLGFLWAQILVNARRAEMSSRSHTTDSSVEGASTPTGSSAESAAACGKDTL